MEGCECLSVPANEAKDKEEYKTQSENYYKKVKRCLQNHRLSVNLVADKKSRMEFQKRCASDLINTVKEKKEFSYSIGTDHPQFLYHERVRVDEVKVTPF